jgi:hypothetical protein
MNRKIKLVMIERLNISQFLYLYAKKHKTKCKNITTYLSSLKFTGDPCRLYLSILFFPFNLNIENKRSYSLHIKWSVKVVCIINLDTKRKKKEKYIASLLKNHASYTFNIILPLFLIILYIYIFLYDHDINNEKCISSSINVYY